MWCLITNRNKNIKGQVGKVAQDSCRQPNSNMPSCNFKIVLLWYHVLWSPNFVQCLLTHDKNALHCRAILGLCPSPNPLSLFIIFLQNQVIFIDPEAKSVESREVDLQLREKCAQQSRESLDEMAPTTRLYQIFPQTKASETGQSQIRIQKRTMST